MRRHEGSWHERWLLLLPLFVSLSCAPAEESHDEQAYVVATLPVVAHIVRPVAGDAVPVRTLIDRPVSPHAHELKPSEAGLIAGAVGIFAASRSIDGWIASYAGQNVHTLFEGSAHAWSDPVLVAESAHGVSAHLCGLFPDNCGGFERRADAFADTLRSLTTQVRSRIGVIRPGTIALSEPFFAPFLERFGLEAGTVLRTVPEHDPSPASVRRAADGASGIRAIIVPSTTRDRLAEQLATARGWTIVPIDPIGLAYDDYASWLTASVDSLLAMTPDS